MRVAPRLLRSLAAPAVLLAGCAAAGRLPAAQPAPVELAADPSLLARRPLAVADVLVADPATAMHAAPVQAALRRAAAREGFAVTAQSPAAGDLVLRASYDWTPLGSAADPRLFLAVSLERDGERIDEAFLQQQEGFPATDPELDALVGNLVRRLARSPRTQGYLKESAGNAASRQAPELQLPR